MVIEQLNTIILELFDVGAVKFGDFKLKSGILSPAYFDLRIIVSYPHLMREISELLWGIAQRNVKCSFQSICGVPYTALPIASIMSVNHNVPMLIRRQEAKDYGTMKMIEGKYKHGDICLVVEDVVTSGSSVYETVQLLKKYDINVHDAVVLLDREQGGSALLQQEGIQLHSVLTITDLLTTLYKHGKVDETMYNKVLTFVAQNKFSSGSHVSLYSGITCKEPAKVEEMTFGERACHCSNPVAKNLFHLIEEKRSNLVLSVDMTKSEDILQLVDQVGDKICMVKTHVDIIEDFSPQFIKSLQDLAIKHKFQIFEDRKFADIGNTVQCQYSSGMYKIADWADITNAHTVPGPGVVQGIKMIGLAKNRACVLIAEMSSKGNLAIESYTQATIKMAIDNSDFVIGFICQKRLCDLPHMIHMTPGVSLKSSTDPLGQQYITPRDAVYKNKSDVIIVGRGIISAKDPVHEAEAYRIAAYNAYLDRLKSKQ